VLSFSPVRVAFQFLTISGTLPKGIAVISDLEGNRTFGINDLIETDWESGDIPGMQNGGENFTTRQGELILMYETWMS